MSVERHAEAVRACEIKITANHEMQERARAEMVAVKDRCNLLYEDQLSLEFELRELRHALELAVHEAATQAVERVGEGDF